MAGDWFETTFDTLVREHALEIGDGFRAKNDELGGDGLIFLRAGHVTDRRIDFSGVERFFTELEPRLLSKLAKPGDAVVTTKGNSTGRTAFVKPSMPPFVYSPHLSYWRSKDRDRVDGGFLHYWSKGAEFTDQLAGMKASTDMAPYLSLVDQKRLKITLPPVSEQRVIAHILGTLDDKIELNRRMSETLEAMARALFKSWFVDFDPVRAKMEGRWQRDQSLLDLPAHLYDLFPDRLVDSELGEIPEGWRVECLGDYIDGERGLSYKGEGLRDDGTGLPMHNLNSIYEGGGYKHEGIKFYAGEYREKHILAAGDLIMTNTEQGFDHLLIGHAAIVPEIYGPRGLYSHHIFRIRMKPGSPFTPQYLMRLFNHPRWHQLISGFSNGTTINMLPADALVIPRIVVPPTALVDVFSRMAAHVHARIEAGRAESLTLASQRDALLPKLISGELRVPEVIHSIEEVA